MSIELKQAAQQALKALEAISDEMTVGERYTNAGQYLLDALGPLRTALSQQPDNASCRSVQKRLEAQQPATGEPVVSRNPFAARCYTMSESHLSGHRLIVGFEKLVDAQDAHEWITRQGRGDFTHPAPSVPADVMRDAERYRWLRDNWFTMGASYPEDTVKFHLGNARWSEQPESNLDAAIDAAMLAAK